MINWIVIWRYSCCWDIGRVIRSDELIRKWHIWSNKVVIGEEEKILEGNKSREWREW